MIERVCVCVCVPTTTLFAYFTSVFQPYRLFFINIPHCWSKSLKTNLIRLIMKFLPKNTKLIFYVLDLEASYKEKKIKQGHLMKNLHKNRFDSIYQENLNICNKNSLIYCQSRSKCDPV